MQKFKPKRRRVTAGKKMKPNDLRIGNLLNYEGKYVQVESIDPHNEVKELGLKCSIRIKEWFTDKHYTYSGKWLNHFKPITLNDEWLARCGFSKRDTSRVWMLAIDYIDSDYPCTLQLSGSGIQICRCGIGAMCAPVFDVHSLQNLYYTLTGQELTINELEK